MRSSSPIQLPLRFKATAEPWRPRPYQKRGMKWLVERNAAALLLKPGFGKTTIALGALKVLRKTDPRRRMLVVAPLAVAYEVWSASGEIGKWTDFKDLRVALLHGPNREAALAADADVYVINHDGLAWLCGTAPGERAPRIAKLFVKGVEVLCLDELSKFKHPSTKRFKLLWPHLLRFRWRWGLTGSPAANGYLDLFGQAKVLDLGKALGKFITHFRHAYFYPTGFGCYEWRLQPHAEERIQAALKPLAMSMLESDYLDLPELVEENLWVTLPDDVAAKYRELEDDLVAELADGTVTAANAAVLSGKLRQFASGGVYQVEKIPPDGKLMSDWLYPADGFLPNLERKTIHLHDAKTDALAELVEELQGDPLFVVFEFHHDLERIRARLGSVPAIDGRTKPAARSQIIKDWNEGRLPVLCVHPQAAAHGLNLQASNCANVCWYTLTWNYEHYDQCVRRVFRSGNRAPRVVVHRILARKTIDKVVADCVSLKSKTQAGLFEALQNYAKNR